jgi:hypothetical protein
MSDVQTKGSPRKTGKHLEPSTSTTITGAPQSIAVNQIGNEGSGVSPSVPEGNIIFSLLSITDILSYYLSRSVGNVHFTFDFLQP